jgi:hypothetical protein
MASALASGWLSYQNALLRAGTRDERNKVIDAYGFDVCATQEK